MAGAILEDDSVMHHRMTAVASVSAFLLFLLAALFAIERTWRANSLVLIWLAVFVLVVIVGLVLGYIFGRARISVMFFSGAAVLLLIWITLQFLCAPDSALSGGACITGLLVLVYASLRGGSRWYNPSSRWGAVELEERVDGDPVSLKKPMIRFLLFAWLLLNAIALYYGVGRLVALFDEDRYWVESCNGIECLSTMSWPFSSQASLREFLFPAIEWIVGAMLVNGVVAMFALLAWRKARRSVPVSA